MNEKGNALREKVKEWTGVGGTEGGRSPTGVPPTLDAGDEVKRIGMAPENDCAILINEDCCWYAVDEIGLSSRAGESRRGHHVPP
jgi:hypothetical protein